jgi:hypothetical protein
MMMAASDMHMAARFFYRKLFMYHMIPGIADFIHHDAKYLIFTGNCAGR